MSARAGIVVTGTEVLTGRVRDRNGPWLSDRLLEMGVELAHITICGDRPQDIEAQLRFLADEGVDLIVTSGGLGPTADDMTVETVARFTGRDLVLDDEVEDKIAAILKPLMARFSHWDFDAVKAANRKQALIPEGAYVIDPVGHRSRRGGGGDAHGRGAAGPAARAPAHVADGGGERAGAGRALRAHGVPAGDGPDVRAAGVGARGHAAGRRGGHRRLRRARDHHLPATRRDRDGHALRAPGRACVRGTPRAPARAARAGDLLRGRVEHRRSGPQSARRAGGSRPRSRAPPACSPRGSPSAQGRPST